VQVGEDAGKDEQCAANGKNPSDDASAAPEEQPNPEEHGQESNAEGVFSVEIPEGAHDRDLVDQQVSANTGHDEPQYKMTESAGRSARVSDCAIVHGRKYSRRIDLGGV